MWSPLPVRVLPPAFPADARRASSAAGHGSMRPEDAVPTQFARKPGEGTPFRMGSLAENRAESARAQFRCVCTRSGPLESRRCRLKRKQSKHRKVRQRYCTFAPHRAIRLQDAFAFCLRPVSHAPLYRQDKVRSLQRFVYTTYLSCHTSMSHCAETAQLLRHQALQQVHPGRPRGTRAGHGEPCARVCP